MKTLRCISGILFCKRISRLAYTIVLIFLLQSIFPVCHQIPVCLNDSDMVCTPGRPTSFQPDSLILPDDMPVLRELSDTIQYNCPILITHRPGDHTLSVSISDHYKLNKAGNPWHLKVRSGNFMAPGSRDSAIKKTGGKRFIRNIFPYDTTLSEKVKSYFILVI